MEQKRNDSIDFAKGFLMIFVILGHIVQGTIEDGNLRGVIYSFHMPLFLFISGYMINLNKLIAQPVKDVFSKYWNRMLKAWLLAYVIFTSYLLLREPTIISVIGLTYSPWGHLWYVPTLFLYILLCKFLFGKTNLIVSYSVLVLLGIAWNYVIQTTSINVSHWFDCSKLPYFALGLYFKNHLNSEKFNKSYIVIPLLYVPLYFAFVSLPFKTFGLGTALLLVGVIILYFYPALKNDTMPKSKVLSYIGKNSLYVYLWHQAPILLLVNYVSECNLTYYYIISFALLFLFILYIKLRKVA